MAADLIDIDFRAHLTDIQQLDAWLQRQSPCRSLGPSDAAPVTSLETYDVDAEEPVSATTFLSQLSRSLFFNGSEGNGKDCRRSQVKWYLPSEVVEKVFKVCAGEVQEGDELIEARYVKLGHGSVGLIRQAKEVRWRLEKRLVELDVDLVSHEKRLKRLRKQVERSLDYMLQRVDYSQTAAKAMQGFLSRSSLLRRSGASKIIIRGSPSSHRSESVNEFNTPLQFNIGYEKGRLFLQSVQCFQVDAPSVQSLVTEDEGEEGTRLDKQSRFKFGIAFRVNLSGSDGNSDVSETRDGCSLVVDCFSSCRTGDRTTSGQPSETALQNGFLPVYELRKAQEAQSKPWSADAARRQGRREDLNIGQSLTELLKTLVLTCLLNKTTARLAGTMKVLEVSVSDLHILTLISPGIAFAWGYGGEGALGHGNYDDEPRPRKVDFAQRGRKEQRIKSVSCSGDTTGASHSVFLSEDGIVFTWRYFVRNS